MTGELAFIEALRAMVTDPGARGLNDDAAVLQIGGEALILTMDTIVEAVHFLSSDPPADVAWKLVAVNVSDLAAKGARPRGCLYSHSLGYDEWDAAFLQGLAAACAHFALPLLGGDSVRMPGNAARSFCLTALGIGKSGAVPDRRSARRGDQLWVSGSIGDAGAGLSFAADGAPPPSPDAATLVSRYRRPDPSPALGMALAPMVHAMMDISDGLLVDAMRLANASGTSLTIDLAAMPLSPAFIAVKGESLSARLTAATAGDDYELLFTAPPEHANFIREAAERCTRTVSLIGEVRSGDGLSIGFGDQSVPLPARLGYQH